MNAKLSANLQKAVDAHAGQPIKVEHPGTHAVYVLIDEETHRRAMRALQEQEDWQSIQRGLTEREQGLGNRLRTSMARSVRNSVFRQAHESPR